jgi:hypothetical protein
VSMCLSGGVRKLCHFIKKVVDPCKVGVVL